MKHKSEAAKTPPPNGKGVLFIIDGLGDLPVPGLGGKTPLEAADTSLLDHMAGVGWYGQVDPILPGKIPNTHSGTGLLMGLAPEHAGRLVRGPVEAAGAGHVMRSGEIAMRTNFATLEKRHGQLYVTDRRAGRIGTGTAELAAMLKDVDLGDGIRASLWPTDQHRGVLIFSGPGLDASVSDTDPGNVEMPADLITCRALSPDAQVSAGKINLFLQQAHRRLSDHPVNIARIRNGKPPANGIITRGAGAHCELQNVLNGLGARTALISGCNTVLGLGRIFGFNTITDPRFTATVSTDLHAKISATVSALDRHDIVFVHIKAPDICAHDRQPSLKRDFLQRIDEALGPLFQSGAVIAVTADHTTDSNTGFHTADPVPALIYNPENTRPLVPIKYGESQCRQGNFGRLVSSEFLARVLYEIGF
jgi:2,3-bisphosphoglycerate-independent phosphoglycerate mutase